MKIKALVSFSGALSMSAGGVVECSNQEIVNDLIEAGYVEKVQEAPKRSVKKGESKPSDS